MKVTILGASGGIARGLRTVSIQVDDDVLIDAGTGVNDLTLEQMASIQHVFLTHAHLDHIACLPMLADAALDRRNGPLTVHALPETLAVLRDCLFNNRVWPDYTVRPSAGAPWVVLEEIALGRPIVLSGRTITPLPARHSVPCAGYAVEGPHGGFAYSGDTAFCEEFWGEVNRMQSLRNIFLECTFRDDVAPEQASEWGHMVPRLWGKVFLAYQGKAEIRVIHMEPGKEVDTLRQLERQREGVGKIMPVTAGEFFDV